MTKLAVFVSGGGTNLQALIDAKAAGRLPEAELALVLSSKPEAYALERAKQAGIPTLVVPRKQYPDENDYDAVMQEALRDYDIGLIVLAGFLSMIGPRVLTEYRGRVINIHPSLIPSFCGRGFYGLKVHQAALARGVKVTGATVFIVDEIPDGGPILLQKAVDVRPGDTPESLQQRVMEEAEWVLLPQAVELMCRRLDDDGQ